MKLLVIDGNSIVNRAFYGIKLLTTKDGRFTNGIYGFLNILLKLREQCEPDAVAIAFDMRSPTFRHKMYDGYKGQRKGMPDELASQMPVLKRLLSELGYKTVECEGYEADDILGTLSVSGGEGDECFIATGDRDSLQLVSNSVKVMLASTKMGRAETQVYDEAKIMEEYGVAPSGLIEIKALMGDSSDNIPGVAGIGKKTAGDLIAKYGTIDNIYSSLDELDIKKGVRDKLAADKDMAYLSRKLGTICLEAPVERDWNFYLPQPPSPQASAFLAELELFSIMKKIPELGDVPSKQETQKVKTVISSVTEPQRLFDELTGVGKIYFSFASALERVCVALGGTVYAFTPIEGFFPLFLDILKNENIKKYTCDIKQLFTFCAEFECEASGYVFDASLAGYLLNPSASDYSALRLAEEYAVGVPAHDGDDKLADSAAVLERLCETLEYKIAENGMEKLLNEIELPLALVLSKMERAGFSVDGEGLKKFGVSLQGSIDDAAAEIHRAAGFEFNINSPKQLGTALFEKMGIPGGKRTKSGYSTSADALEKLAPDYPVVSKVLEYRTLSKLKSTYCDGLAKALSDDGRIHSTLNQTETRTGRISSAEPNLQNIPVRQPLGRELRRFFKAKEGFVLVDADYSQIELRVLAHMANDSVMLEAFNNDEDIHAITASQVFNMPLNMVTPLMRSRAKAVNFGIVYGIGAFSLGKDIGVSRAEADSYIKGYLNKYSGVKAFMENSVSDAKNRGYAVTLFGRRRYLPELASSNGMLRAFGERVAMNMPIQGTAADIIKIAMIKVSKRLEAENINARLIMQVHDELIVEAAQNDAERAANVLREEMENACSLSVRLRADVGMGKTWFEAKE